LALRGHSRSDDWHLAHLYAPGTLLPGSAMPASRHLFTVSPGDTVPRPNGEALDLVAFLQALGRSDRDIWAEDRGIEPGIPPPPEVPRERLLEEGTRLYRKHCVACHGAEGDGRGEAAALLRFPPRDFVAARYRFRSTPPGFPAAASDLYRSITLGGGSGAAMPSFRHLTSDERWALVARVIEFSPRLRGAPLEPAPDAAESDAISVPPPAAAIEAGRRWWLDLGCAGCHAGDGRGIDRLQGGFDWVDQGGVPVPGSGDLRHACGLRGGASAVALARALRNGVGDAMPAYADALAPPEIAELVAYLLSLQHPVAAGGEADGTAVEAVSQAATGPGTRNRP
ncbi:MAG TPA: c-type cytochrome, partial [Candidatus Polarisedimenticolia bacterium]|nr:c-type cytochrome [Candidatus Polarisedimenticolia bacterium]